MRIISGCYRGKKLTAPSENAAIRPTTDRTKEAVFNIIFDRITAETVFFDVFSGSGAIGIEALSRGVKKVFFIDSGDESISLIKKNLNGIKGDYEIIKKDFAAALRDLSKRNVRADVIYCDPPYAAEFGGRLLIAVKNLSLLNDGGIILIERAKTLSAPACDGFIMTDSRSYALSAVDFFRREKRAAVTGTFDPVTKGHLYLIEKASELFDRVYAVILKNENKIPRFSVEERKKMLELTVGDSAVTVESYDGLTIDYCKSRSIGYIVRGVRDEKDMAYELEMSEWNEKHGGVKTLIFPAKDKEISSTEVKKRLDDSDDVSAMVSSEILSLLKKEE